MPFTPAERKHRMPYGGQKAVAEALGSSEPYVSAVMNGDVHPKTETAQKRLRETQEALAQRLGVPLEEAFPEAQEEAPQRLAAAS